MVDTVRNSEELVDSASDSKSDPSSDPKVDTYTTNGKSPQKLFKNGSFPKIIQDAIHPIDHQVTKDVKGIRETLGAR